MGIHDTFACLRQLPRERQFSLCRAALEEPHAEVQLAAMRALLDTKWLDRPEVVADRYEQLLPEVREAARQHRDDLLRVARQRMALGKDAHRLQACRLMIEVGGPAAIASLVEAVLDPLPAVRDLAAGAVMTQMREFVTAVRMVRAGEEHELFTDGWDSGLWSALEAMLCTLPQHGRSEFFELLPELGEAAGPVVANLLAAHRDDALRRAIHGALVRGAVAGAAEVTVTLAAHGEACVRELGLEVLGERDGFEFGAAVVEFVAGRDRGSHDPVRATPWTEHLESVVGSLSARVAHRILSWLPDLPAKDRQQACVVALLGHSDPGVALAAARLVVELDLPERTVLLTPLLGSSSSDLRQFAMREVSQVSFGHYLGRFDGMNPRAREVAARALAKIDSDMLDRLAEEVGALDSDRRFKALQIIGYLDAEEDLRAPLMALLEDPDRRVRATAIRIVEMTGSIPGMKALIDALSDTDRRVRANAIEAFERLGDQGYVDIFVPFLHDRDNRVRANAAKALWNLGYAGARDALRDMLHDDQDAMRMSAAWALGELRCEGALELLDGRIPLETSAAVRAKIHEVKMLLAVAEEGT